MTAVLRKMVARLPLSVFGGIVASITFAAIAFAQDADDKCLENVSQICDGTDADDCFAKEKNWSRVLPECIGDVQTLVEIANEAKAEMMKEGASLGGKVRSGPGTKFSQTASLVEGDLVSLEENSGVMLDGYAWFKIVQYDNRTGAETLAGYQWGGILCAFNDVPGVLRKCPSQWSVNPEIPDMSGSDIGEDAIAPVHGNSDEDNAEIDIAMISKCIADENANDRDGAACIGRISGKCLDDDISGTNAAMRLCISYEHKAWDSLLNANYQNLMASLDNDANRTSLRDAQRLWNKFVEAFCLLGYQFNQGSLFLLSGVQCLMEMTARQDLELRKLAGGAQ